MSDVVQCTASDGLHPGILISNEPALTALTFESTPKWHKLNEEDNLFQKVQSAKDASWGGTTDFKAALDLILKRCVESKVPLEEVQEMTFAIFSDMQFNAADGQEGYYGRGGPAFSTKIQEIRKAFAKAGYKDPETGEGLMPRMLFWNLRGDTLDFPSDANTPGVDMVSGFSANGLKAFMAGEDMQSADPDKKETPYDGMRKQLDVERYDEIRSLCETVGEIVSKTSGQAYVAPVRESDEDEEDEEKAVLVKALDEGAQGEEEAVDVEQIDAEVQELEAQLEALRAKKAKATGEKSKGGWGFGW